MESFITVDKNMSLIRCVCRTDWMMSVEWWRGTLSSGSCTRRYFDSDFKKRS